MITATDNSKQAANKILPLRKNFIYFLGSIVVALLLTYLIRSQDFTDSQNYVLFLLFFAVGLWLTEAIPPFATALVVMAFLFFSLGHASLNTNAQNASKYVQTFSSSVVWLMLGGFFLAEAMTKTGLDATLLKFSLKLCGAKPKNLLLGLMATTMVASMFLSNTATTAMVIASIMPLLKQLDKKPFAKALVIGIPLASSVGGMGTIIGSPTNAIAVGALTTAGISVSFVKWMVIGVPLALILTLLGWFILGKKYITDSEPLPVDLITGKEQATDNDQKKKRLLVVIIFVVTVLLWLTGSFFNLTVAAVAALPIVLLPVTGILKASDMRKLPWDTLILVAGGLSLGLALEETGMLQYFTQSIRGAGLSNITLLFIFAFGTMVFSNVMSNTATSTILVPLGIFMMPNQAMQVAVIIGLAASTALLLPVSTPPNAIAYSTGMIKQKDFLLGGVVMGLIGPILIVLLVLALL